MGADMTMAIQWTPVLAVCGALVVLMALLSSAPVRRHLHVELSRKVLHVVMGLVTLSFPWVFDGLASVVVLAALSLAWLELVRLHAPLRAAFACVLTGVARSGRGEAHFVLGTALTFALAGGDPLRYCVPMAILTFADAAAALVGRELGQRPGVVRYGHKSLAGSIAFFVVASVCALTGLLHAGWALPLVMTLVLAVVTTFVEAVCDRGLDNLLIPVTAGVLMALFAEPDLPSIFIGTGLLTASMLLMRLLLVVRP